MKGQVSPFAALTGEEKQLKWLEYQSIRLPYTETAVEKSEAPVTPAPSAAVAAAESPRQLKETEKPPAPVRQAPEKQAVRTSGPSISYSDFQKTRHQQYDAVIARMKQAERQAVRYQPLPHTPQ